MNMNKLFGKIAPGMCRLTMNGNVAVSTKTGFKTYNVKTGTLTNVSNFCIDPGMDLFFLIPTNKVNVGDIILVDDKPKCVIATDKKFLTVIDYETSEIKQIVPERQIFMGNTVFFGKITSMMGNVYGKGKGMQGMLKMLVASQLFGGNNNGGETGVGLPGMGNLGQLMAMQMMMGGDNNLFEGMFDGFVENDEDEASEDEAPEL